MKNKSRLYRISFLLLLACQLCRCTSNPETTGVEPNNGSEGEENIEATDRLDDSDADGGDRIEDSDQSCQKMRVDLPPYDFNGSDIARVDLDYLNDLATDYVCSKEGSPADADRFFYGWAPIKLFNEIIEGNDDDIEVMRWIFHVSGYFGGVWLHNGLNSEEAQDAGLDTGDDTTNGGMDFALLDGEKIARQAIAALEGPEEKLFEYNKNSLLAFLLPNLGIAWNFGYNRGYLLEIYLRPPKGIVPPPDYVSCTGSLWCDYGIERLPILASLKEVSSNIDTLGGRWKELREGSLLNPLDGIKAAQSSGHKMGQMVWGSFFDKSDMAKQEFYTDLLDVSASFLAVVQAAGLLSARGYGARNVEAARQGALIQSGLGYWLGAYMQSFSGGPSANASLQPLPTIVPIED